ncbi:LapA family protein [Paracoccaceae bacterium Fryx2]|nr:LapA family protein [Paracoccaceae bacterium Fryx2]
MIRYLRYLLIVLLAICLLVVALANRTMVTLHAMPDDLAAFAGFSWSQELPLFLVIFGGIVIGLLIGFFWEWLREHRHRSVATAKSREVTRLERELAGLREAKAQPRDEVLAILQDKKPAN